MGDIIDREALREALINRFTPIPDTVSIAYWPHDIVLEVLDAQATPTCAGCDCREGSSHYCSLWSISTPDDHYCADHEPMEA